MPYHCVAKVEREQPGSYAHFSDVMYQKTASKEVDFCGPRIGKLGFEGKYVDSGWKREAWPSTSGIYPAGCGTKSRFSSPRRA
jgi:hypothetical protein